LKILFEVVPAGNSSMKSSGYRTIVAHVLLALVLFNGTSGVYAQQQPGITTSDGDGTVSAEAGSMTLSASSLIEMLRERPELVVELKKVAADRLTAQGIPTQEDSITDEMLYSLIATDAALRSAITVWLRARGYPSAESVTSQQADVGDGDEDQSRSEYLAQMESVFPANRDASALQTSGDLGDYRNTAISKSRPRSEAAAEQSSITKPRKPQAEPRPEANDSSAAQVLHRPSPYNLLSLRDLYTQVPEQSSSLRRFGSELFINRGTNRRETALDVPIGPDYILGPGDGLTIDLWGGMTQRITRTIDQQGRIVLPEAGPVVLAGLSLGQAQKTVEDALGSQFRNARAEVSITRLHTIRIYVVGDVQRPGAYDVSSVSTPLNALIAAGGPTPTGSLRTIRHYRGQVLLREIDLYDFFLRGVRPDTERLQPGDTILVPPVGSQVTLSGMVRRPAIYELRSESSLKQVVDLGGGLLVSAATTAIKVERIEAHQDRVSLSVDLPASGLPDALEASLRSFVVKDGDRVLVAPILPYSEKAIYLEGHVVRPGKHAFRDNMTLIDAIHSYQDLLPEPADRGVIIRLRAPDYRPETIEFSLSEVLIGNDPVNLEPFDTVRVYSRYELDPPTVTIQGEIAEPGAYPLSQGMTAAQLVRMAGGFKRSALLDDADLISYRIKGGRKVISQRTEINIGRAVKDKDSSADVELKPGDVLTIHQLSGWNDIGASVTLKGEVAYSGVYGIQEGERLSSVLKRAGGFTNASYPTGAVLLRNQVRELEEKSRGELIRQIEMTSGGTKVSPNITGNQDQLVTLQLVAQQQQQVLQRLKTQPPSGRLVIKISTDIASWENTVADIDLRAGDVIAIPKKPSFVLVTGQVYNGTGITYVPGKNAGWYLRRAGGPTDMANRKEIFVIKANGSVIGRRSNEWYQGDVLSTAMEPGDVVVVPQKIVGGSMVWRNMLATAQVLSSIAITAKLAGL
jgi:protein involved in polysaccharide export with SLBB domain